MRCGQVLGQAGVVRPVDGGKDRVLSLRDAPPLLDGATDTSSIGGLVARDTRLLVPMASKTGVRGVDGPAVFSTSRPSAVSNSISAQGDRLPATQLECGRAGARREPVWARGPTIASTARARTMRSPMRRHSGASAPAQLNGEHATYSRDNRARVRFIEHWALSIDVCLYLSHGLDLSSIDVRRAGAGPRVARGAQQII
jgi:hypothetical protein